MDSPLHPDQRISAGPVLSPQTSFVPVGSWNTDGLIVLPSVRPYFFSQYLDELNLNGFPMVFTQLDNRGTSVVLDSMGGLFQAVEHLWQHGHRRIAYIAGFKNGIGDSLLRLEGFRTAMKSFGSVADPNLIAYGEHSVSGGRAAMAQLLNYSQSFTALIVGNFESAVGAMQVLKEAGYRVPEDLAFISVNDPVAADAQIPPFTTVHLQTFEQGYEAVDLLVKTIEGNPPVPKTVQIPAQLVIRRSCGCQPYQSEGVKIVSPPLAPAAITEPVMTKSQLANLMTRAAQAKSYRLNQQELTRWFLLLIDSFLMSAGNGSEASFLTTLLDILHYVQTVGDGPYLLQSAVSVLTQFYSTLTINPDDPGSIEFGYQLIDKARQVIIEHERQYEALSLVELQAVADRFGTMTAQLLAASNPAQVLKILETSLPDVGIQDFQIAMFEPLQEDEEDDDIVGKSTLLALDPSSAGLKYRPFLTRSFPPGDLYPAGEPYSLLLTPLMLQEKQIGFIAYDTGNIDLCGAITRNVSAALLNCKLYNEAADGRKLAEEADQLKTKFLSMVSHELRSPLSVIVGLSELILREHSEGKPAPRQDLERINASAQHLGLLIRDVLDLSTNQAGQLRLSLEPVNLVEALQPVLVTVGQLARDKGLSWQLTIPDQPAMVLGDRTRLRQVVLNLVSNAIKFTANGSIKLVVEITGEQVSVWVRDTGIGISSAEQNSIFDEFSQSERTASRGYGGFGLGLAISRHLVELHGGTINVSSSGVEGEGATFWFTLPLLEQQEATESAQPGRPLVVVVTNETNSKNIEGIKVALHSQDLEVVVYPPAEMAQWQLRLAAAPPEAILVDQRLSATAGWDVFRGLQNYPATQNIPAFSFSWPGTVDSSLVIKLGHSGPSLDLAQFKQLLSAPPVATPAFPTILMVDDDLSILEMYTRLVQSTIPNCNISYAHNGLQAVKFVQNRRPDLILLDLMMPELDGFGTLEVLRGNPATRDIPVIVLSDRALTEEEMGRLNQQSVVMVLEKGVISAEETITQLGKVLDRTNRPGSAPQLLVRRAIAYIHANFAQPITRELLAQYLSVNENYLSTCFQQETGISPLTFLNRFRIKKACELLEQPDQTVTEVALAVGFSDIGYFSRVFQREVGKSPSAYRRSHRLH
ncbi:MAG: substrate-binding domain-containing protein [Candidatus Melainabacteria bacterium]|nr:substrate-binding domain-containing protein [Candidatus Melainabacteria bacterium]